MIQNALITFAVKYITVGKVQRHAIPIVASTSKVSCNASLRFRVKTVLRKVCKRELTLVESENSDFFSIRWLWLLSAIFPLAGSNFTLEITVGVSERSLTLLSTAEDGSLSAETVTLDCV